MSIKIIKGPKLVQREIVIKEPIRGSGFKQHKVIVDFEIIAKSEAQDLGREGDTPLLKRVLIGWGDPQRDGRGGFENDDGSPIAFTPENFDELIDIQWISAGLARGYMEAVYGGKLGN